MKHAACEHRLEPIRDRASAQFVAAQHPVLETNDEKRCLHGRCLANY